MNLVVKLFQSILLGLIQFYKKAISPILPSSCRFEPTCSTYAKTAIERFGPWKGSWLAIKRLSKCHPFGGHGFDPVPKK